jgi:hypothetical protein
LARGDFVFTVVGGEHPIQKTVHVSDEVARRSPARVQPGLIAQLLHPSEPPLEANGPVARLTIRYEEATVHVLGFRLTWLVVYVVLTMAAAVLMARAAGVAL